MIMLVCSQEMHNLGYAWRTIKDQLGEDMENHIHRMTFLKGKTGVCFDVPADKVKHIQETWKDGRRWQLTVATELPELEEKQFSNPVTKALAVVTVVTDEEASEVEGGEILEETAVEEMGSATAVVAITTTQQRGGQKRSFSQAFDY
uniref:DEAD (Asp-Glu-Ala-Asp) box helicase 21 n=1 Tax=Myripristis murdjan TaxID=586833 RepID=A0A667XJQ4_9TELE